MSDFSAFSLFTAGLACLIPFTTAYTQPKGAAPSGNPIFQPGLNSIVPAGDNFTITWNPTTPGTVTLVLLKGPSSNAVPQYAIVEKTPNDGAYVWSVASNLEPTTGAQGYGIQLIDDATGQYQYTTQFGISNPDYKEPKSETTSSTSTVEPTSYGGKTSSVPSYSTKSSSTTPKPYWTTSTSCAPTSTGHYSVPHNVTMVAPTAYYPSSTSSSSSTASAYGNATATSSPIEVSTGGASALARSVGGLVLAAGVAVFAF